MKVKNTLLLLVMCIGTAGITYGAAAITVGMKLKALEQFAQSINIADVASKTAATICADCPDLPESFKDELEKMYANSVSVEEIRLKTGKPTSDLIAAYRKKIADKKSAIAWQLMVKCVADPSQENFDKNFEQLKQLKKQYGLVKGPAGETLLIEAVIAGNRPVGEWLIDEEKVDINEQGAQGTTAFMEAVKTYKLMVEAKKSLPEINVCQTDMILWLSSRGASSLIPNNDGQTAQQLMASIKMPGGPVNVSTTSTATTSTTVSGETKSMTKKEQLLKKLAEKKNKKEAQQKAQSYVQPVVEKQLKKQANKAYHALLLAEKEEKNKKNAQKQAQEFARYMQKNGITSLASTDATAE